MWGIAMRKTIGLRILELMNLVITDSAKLRLVKFYKALPFALPQIMLHPTFACNYRCSYCSYKHVPVSLMKSKLIYIENKVWIRLFNKFPPSLISISGGEPLMYKDLDKLLLGLSKRHLISQIVTNISANIESLIRAKKAGFRILASFHPEMTSLEVFGRNANILKKEGFNIIVSCVGTDTNLSKGSFYKEYFEKKLKLPFRVDAFVGPDEKCDENIQTNFPVHGKNYILNNDNFNNYDRKKCLGGSKYFLVLPDASVYRCYGGFWRIARNKITAGGISDSVIGDLKDKDFHVDSSRFICHYPCRSVCDIELADVIRTPGSKSCK